MGPATVPVFPRVLGKVCDSEVSGSEINSACGYLTQGSEQQERQRANLWLLFPGRACWGARTQGRDRKELGQQLCEDVGMKNEKSVRAGRGIIKAH